MSVVLAVVVAMVVVIAVVVVLMVVAAVVALVVVMVIVVVLVVVVILVVVMAMVFAVVVVMLVMILVVVQCGARYVYESDAGGRGRSDGGGVDGFGDGRRFGRGSMMGTSGEDSSSSSSKVSSNMEKYPTANVTTATAVTNKIRVIIMVHLLRKQQHLHLPSVESSSLPDAVDVQHVDFIDSSEDSEY